MPTEYEHLQALVSVLRAADKHGVDLAKLVQAAKDDVAKSTVGPYTDSITGTIQAARDWVSICSGSRPQTDALNV